jgi:hypothetical protein
MSVGLIAVLSLVVGALGSAAVMLFGAGGARPDDRLRP